MSIAALRVSNFRNIETSSLEPCKLGLNIICGNNGSGKTSLLETIYYLGHGRSFKGSKLDTLIRQQQDKFALYAQVQYEGVLVPLGVEREQNGSSRFRLSEKNTTSMAKLAQYLPIRIVNSYSHQLFESGPSYRRQYMDWGLFYQSERFLKCWRQFERTLRQRNSVLRERRPKKEWDIWTETFVNQSLELDALRRDYVDLLRPAIAETSAALLDGLKLELNYQSGWDSSQNLNDILANSYMDEMRIGHSQYGPHRADLDVTIDGVSAKHILSRGQQKLMICAMILAQGKLVSQHINRGLIYLIDDLPSELDVKSKQRLIALLAEQPTQVFITAIEKESILDFIDDNNPRINLKVFHVEHGRVVEVADSTAATV